MFKLNVPSQSNSDENVLYDVIIVGAGAAGFTSAIYAARDGWKTLILEKGASGGLTATTHLIENYPGFPDGIEGAELMERFQAQAKKFGAKIVEFEEVVAIHKIAGKQGWAAEHFQVMSKDGNTYRGRVVLLATGSQPKRLNVPGEAEFYSRGVSYCATCDGPLYKDRDTVVVGCGNSGLQEAEILLQYAKSVTFVEFLGYSIAEKVLQERIFSHPKTTCLFNHVVIRIKGGKTVSSVVVKNRETGEEKEIPTAVVFIYVGYQPYTDFVKGLVELDEFGYIITDEHMATSMPGIFAAGDVRSKNLAQTSVAVGDGAKAAKAIREYLQKQKI